MDTTNVKTARDCIWCSRRDRIRPPYHDDSGVQDSAQANGNHQDGEDRAADHVLQDKALEEETDRYSHHDTCQYRNNEAQMPVEDC